jgi:hypothetical protein
MRAGRLTKIRCPLINDQLGDRLETETTNGGGTSPPGHQRCRRPLHNDTFSVYLYVGGEADDGWRVAKLAYSLLPRIRVYCVTQPDLASAWAPGGASDFSGGIVFGWDSVPAEYLLKNEAGNLERVIGAIQAARA